MFRLTSMALAGLALAGSVRAAAPAPGPYPDAVMAGLFEMMRTHVAPRFTVFGDDELDADSRAAAQAMSAAHLPRVEALVLRWLKEEWTQDPDRALVRVYARLANEFALWGRDRLDATDDARLAQALSDPAACRWPGPHPSELVMRLARYRSLPLTDRRAALQSEAALLARWGENRSVDTSEPLPIDPIVATPPDRCAIHQAAGATPAQFRAAMALPVADLVWMPRDVAAAPASPNQAYPRLAQHFGVQGTVGLEAEVDRKGQALNFRIVERRLTVPGLGTAPPLAFSTSLDAATLALARTRDWTAAAPTDAASKWVRQEFRWTLTLPQPAAGASADAQPTAGKAL
jgi:hypothetical protein